MKKTKQSIIFADCGVCGNFISYKANKVVRCSFCGQLVIFDFNKNYGRKYEENEKFKTNSKSWNKAR